MGLDMYLYARRRFAPDSPEAGRIVEAASLPLAELQDMAARDPMEHVTSVYLAMWEFTPEADKAGAAAVIEAASLLTLGTFDSPHGHLGWSEEEGAVEVSICAVYWRKANAVHGWFVEECQGGVDECQETEVHVEKLAELASMCTKAAEKYRSGEPAAAAEIMTPTEGCFFGGTEVDDGYVQDLEHTAVEVERVIKTAVAIGGVDFTYQSSW